MKKHIIFIALLTNSFAAIAQETYESANIATHDLSGTARYIGMGGAMEALGADISTISTNPAGIGLFRKCWVGTTFGVNVQPEQKNYTGSGKTTASFNQFGFVYSTRTSENCIINFGANFSKSRDFNQILAAAGKLNGGSQNKLSYIKMLNGANAFEGGYYPYLNNQNDYEGREYRLSRDQNGDYYTEMGTYTARAFSVVDYIYTTGFLSDGNDGFDYNNAESYSFKRNNKGYIGNYEMNLSGNYLDRFYFGITMGLKDVHYNASTTYTENLIDRNNSSIGSVTITDDRKITGHGFDVKAGVIFRPIEESPFRIGLSIASPTWYELTSSNDLKFMNASSEGLYDSAKKHESYKYKMFTPWKFGASLGHTIDNCIALGLSYEYADYSTIDNRYITEEWYNDWDGSYDSSSESDAVMNQHTKKSLCGVSTIKAGAEYKLTNEFSVRLGYNYVSPMYKTTASKDGGLNSDGSYYASTTDYTNWKATNRLTAGIGFTKDNFTVDIAYQYSTQKGDFYPFQELAGHYHMVNETCSGNYNDNYHEYNHTSATEVKNDRHQIMMTLGYRF